MSSCSEQRFVIDAPIVAELEARKHGLPTRGRNKQYLAIRGGSLEVRPVPYQCGLPDLRCFAVSAANAMLGFLAGNLAIHLGAAQLEAISGWTGDEAGLKRMLDKLKCPVYITRSKKHQPGFPPPGTYLVSDNGAHFDSMTVLEDGRVEFYPTESAVSTSVCAAVFPGCRHTPHCRSCRPWLPSVETGRVFELHCTALH